MYFPVLLQMLNIILTESYKIFVKNRDLIYMTRFQIVPTQQDISDIASITAMVEAAQADRHPTAVETPEQSSVQCAGKASETGASSRPFLAAAPVMLGSTRSVSRPPPTPARSVKNANKLYIPRGGR